MAIIKCPECGTEYLTTNDVCPYCGCPRPLPASSRRQSQRQPSYQPPQPKKSSGCMVYVVFLCVLLMLISVGAAFFFFKQHYDSQVVMQQQKERLEKIRRDSLAELRRKQEQSVQESKDKELKRQLLLADIEKMVKNWVNTDVWYHASAELRHYHSACVRDYSFDDYSELPLFEGDAFYGIEDVFQPGQYVLKSYCLQLDGDNASLNVKFNMGNGSTTRILNIEKTGQEWQLVDFKDPSETYSFLTEIKEEIARKEAEGLEVYYTE